MPMVVDPLVLGVVMAQSPQYITLTASAVSTIEFDLDCEWVEVMNLTGTADVFFRVDGENPGVAATGSEVVGAAIGAALTVPVPTAGNTTVKLISAGTPKIAVRGNR